MRNYTVKSRLSLDNQDYEIGSPVELSDEDAAPLLAVHCIAEIVEEKPSIPTDPGERRDAITLAVLKLDTANAENWMKDGRPALEPLSSLLGWRPTGMERDEAWKILHPTTG